MSHHYDFDHLSTDNYMPGISHKPTTPGNHICPYINLETRRFQEGRVVDPSLIYDRDINMSFRAICLDCLLHINEYICPRFVVEFFQQVELVHNEDQSLSLWFWIRNFKFVLTLEQFAQILRIPNHGQCAYTEDWCLESLFNYREENSPYCSYIPTPSELTKLLRTHKTFLFSVKQKFIWQRFIKNFSLEQSSLRKTFLVYMVSVSNFPRVVLICCLVSSLINHTTSPTSSQSELYISKVTKLSWYLMGCS